MRRMIRFIVKFLLTAVLVYGLSHVLPNVRLDGVGSAALLIIVLGILNAVLRPILKLLGFPVTVLTLGLFLLVINVIIIKAADGLMDSFSVVGFFSALLFSFGLSLVNAVVDMVMGDKEIMPPSPRIQLARGFLMNHLYHHRGEMIVYLRATGNKVPSIYGPTADDRAAMGQ